MLYSFKRLLGSPVMATDGVAGHVHDAVLDDQDWRIRHLLVRLPEADGHALLPIGRVLTIRPDQGGLSVADDRQTVCRRRASDAELTVAERAALAFQQVGSPSLSVSPEINGVPNLRSCRELAGYWLVAADGDIGEVEDLAVDGATWTVGGICFHRSGTSQVLPIRCIDKAAWMDRILTANVPAAFACRAPIVVQAGRYDADTLRLFADQAGPGPEPATH